MNQKALGIVLIVFGGYLAVGNTIFSVLFNQVFYSGGGPIGNPPPISPWNYWLNWFALYGSITLLVATAGIILILLGIGALKKYKRETNETVLITQQT